MKKKRRGRRKRGRKRGRRRGRRRSRRRRRGGRGRRRERKRKKKRKRKKVICLTFQSLAVSLLTTRFNIKKFCMVLALHSVFCADLRTDSGFCLT